MKGLPPVPGGDTVMTGCNFAPIDSPKIRGESSGENKNELPNNE